MLHSQLLVRSILSGLVPCFGPSSTFLISKGDTHCIGHCNCFSFCSRITPLATPSASVTIQITFSFLQHPRFFSSPKMSTISPTFNGCVSSCFTWWISMRLWRYFLCHLVHALRSCLWNLVRFIFNSWCLPECTRLDPTWLVNKRVKGSKETVVLRRWR